MWQLGLDFRLGFKVVLLWIGRIGIGKRSLYFRFSFRCGTGEFALRQIIEQFLVGFVIHTIFFVTVTRTQRQVKQKPSLRGVWNVVLDLVFLEVPGDASGFRDELADVAAVRVENFLFAH